MPCLQADQGLPGWKLSNWHTGLPRALTPIQVRIVGTILFATQPRKMWWTHMRKPVYFLLWLINLKI
jgi:hypothetical protein